MTERSNTSNISILQTNIIKTGIQSIANGVRNNSIAKTLVEQAWIRPKQSNEGDSFYLRVHNQLKDN